MFIQTETTPNPATLKFLPGLSVMEEGTADYQTADDAGNSPLAQRLFAVAGVRGVFLGSDFVTITKDEATDWDHAKPRTGCRQKTAGPGRQRSARSGFRTPARPPARARPSGRAAAPGGPSA